MGRESNGRPEDKVEDRSQLHHNVQRKARSVLISHSVSRHRISVQKNPSRGLLQARPKRFSFFALSKAHLVLLMEIVKLDLSRILSSSNAALISALARLRPYPFQGRSREDDALATAAAPTTHQSAEGRDRLRSSHGSSELGQEMMCQCLVVRKLDA